MIMITNIMNIILLYLNILHYKRIYILLKNKKCVINTIFFILIYGNGVAWSFET